MKNSAHKKNIKLLTLFLFASVAAGSAPAKAAKIQNLSDKAETIEVESSEGFKPVVIPPGQGYDAMGQIKVKYHGREIRVEHNEEYAIWKDGTFGPQRRTPAVKGGPSIN